MEIKQETASLPLVASLVFLFLPFTRSLALEEINQAKGHKSVNHNIHKLSSKMSFDITLHGLLLWASMGFLTPIGILIIRISNKGYSRRKFKILFYFHIILQILSVLLATAGAVMSIKSFENTFHNSHQRLGLALYGAIWVQAFIGFFRPKRGVKGRGKWYFIHWMLGTFVSLIGTINIYTGLQAYHERTLKSVTLWNILYTAEVSFMAFLYLFQDKWEYMQKQRVIIGNNEMITPANQPNPPLQLDTKNELVPIPCTKRNALKNHFLNDDPSP
ncbi:Cytochrome b561/ferric reductase transmembrane [Dillenia turbinata]|uniref:Cytochrome b561/ferric reductase transmembrane n=1 Tax=Dillenia turbinata TaxID=194707 RepID=A0AAN8UXC9_9MAGN